ncbi:MAG: hypothetical protein ACREC8_11220 [Limisphaerales bacterium]
MPPTESPALHQTPTTATVKVAEAKPRFDPTRLFVQKDKLVWFWFGFAMLVLAGEAVDHYVIVQSFKQRERVVVIDPANTFYVSPLLKFEDAKELHVEQSTLAATAFLERNPNSFDNEDLLKKMFLKSAYLKALAYQAAEQPEFKSKQLHQKVEISGITVLNTREDFALTQVSGQLIRDGVFEDKSFTEAVPFKLSLKLQRNPNMVQNGRFPTAVNDFKYETLAH